jgi:hypothetical protein
VADEFSGAGTIAEAERIPGDRNRGDDTMLRFPWFGENGENFIKSSR